MNLITAEEIIERAITPLGAAEVALEIGEQKLNASLLLIITT